MSYKLTDSAPIEPSRTFGGLPKTAREWSGVTSIRGWRPGLNNSKYRRFSQTSRAFVLLPPRLSRRSDRSDPPTHPKYRSGERIRIGSGDPGHRTLGGSLSPLPTRTLLGRGFQTGASKLAAVTARNLSPNAARLRTHPHSDGARQSHS